MMRARRPTGQGLVSGCGALCWLLLLAAGCGRTSGPPRDQIEARIRATLPAYLQVTRFESESLAQAPDAWLVTWKAAVAPKEDLYAESPEWVTLRELTRPGEVSTVEALRGTVPKELSELPFSSFVMGVDGSLTSAVPTLDRTVLSGFRQRVETVLREYGVDQRFMKLRLTQPAGKESTVYGKVVATRLLDKWEWEELPVDAGFEQFGNPLGSFGSQYLIPDAPETQRRVEEFRAACAEKEKQLAAIVAEFRAAQQKAERAAQDQAELKKKELAQQNQRNLEATKPGRKYAGTYQVVSTALSGEIGIEFQEQTENGGLKALLYDPKDPSRTRALTGQVLPPEEQYPIRLQAVPSTGGFQEGVRPGQRWDIFKRSAFGGIQIALEGDSLAVTAANVMGSYRFSLLKPVPGTQRP